MGRNIKEIVKQMTLKEKCGMCSGLDFWHLKGVERLGVPSVMVTDGPHGLRKQSDAADHLGINDSIKAVCFPAASASAASFDVDLLQQMGEALGEECRAENVSVLLGPAVNIKRSPLCGRNFEYFSEDPYLTGKLAAAQIKGVQKWDVGTSIKHFAANSQEFRRFTCSSEVDEQTLREIYLTAFEIAVKEAKPWTVMCSYNRLNGLHASESPKLLTDILRTEWGFEGYVVSDWGAINDRVAGLKAGLELEMPSSGGINDEKLEKAVLSKKLDVAVLDRAVTRLLNIIFRYADISHPEAKFDKEHHHSLAANIEKECAVLLKNNGVLPLTKTQNIAYIGGFAKAPRYQGGGSSHINASKVVSAVECADNVVYSEGFSSLDDKINETLMGQAVKAAQDAEVAVVFAGLPDIYESEGYDRTHMKLPEGQNQLISRIAAVQKNTVVVLHTGSPVEAPWANDVSAILCMYLGGEGVGEATNAVLYGDANPSGKLPETWPLRLEDTPSYLTYFGDSKTVKYTEGIYVGYRYYDKKKMPVQWAFGHGLSYTSFEITSLALSSNEMAEGKEVTATVSVKNTGKRSGKEVVQLYIADKTGTFGRPLKELKSFAKVTLNAGEEKSVTFKIDTRSLSYFNEDLNDWYAKSGNYEIIVAQGVENICKAAVLKYTSKRSLPFVVTANTTIADLLEDSRTATHVQKMLDQHMGSMLGGGSDTDAAKEAINAEMSKQMMLNAPLRTVQLFAKIPDIAFKGLLLTLNALASKK